MYFENEGEKMEEVLNMVLDLFQKNEISRPYAMAATVHVLGIFLSETDASKDDCYKVFKAIYKSKNVHDFLRMDKKSIFSSES